jgi:hypothetical protein
VKKLGSVDAKVEGRVTVKR